MRLENREAYALTVIARIGQRDLAWAEEQFSQLLSGRFESLLNAVVAILLETNPQLSTVCAQLITESDNPQLDFNILLKLPFYTANLAPLGITVSKRCR